MFVPSSTRVEEIVGRAAKRAAVSLERTLRELAAIVPRGRACGGGIVIFQDD
jgi:predicted sugar kinase